MHFVPFVAKLLVWVFEASKHSNWPAATTEILRNSNLATKKLKKLKIRRTWHTASQDCVCG